MVSNATAGTDYQAPISLTTTGTSGAATFTSNTLNIPQYQGGVTSFNTRTGAITLLGTDVTGALGFTPENVKTDHGIKKPKNQKLTNEQKEMNKLISSFRVTVEHAIGSIKRYRIVKDECRLRKTGILTTFSQFVQVCITSD